MGLKTLTDNNVPDEKISLRSTQPFKVEGVDTSGSRERRITTVCCDETVPPRGQIRMVLAWPRPPTGERITTVCCDEAVPPLGQVGEENHDGMLR